MLIGNWKNIDELEECLCLDELTLILSSRREEQLRMMKFQASLKGIDLDKNIKKSAEEDFLRVQRKVEAQKAGISEEAFGISELGFDFEEEDE